jgi:hypothetical protein
MAHKNSGPRSSSAVFSLSAPQMNGSHTAMGLRLADGAVPVYQQGVRVLSPEHLLSSRRNRSVRSHRRQRTLRRCIVPTDAFSHFDFVTYAQDSARRAGTSVLTEDRLI